LQAVRDDAHRLVARLQTWDREIKGDAKRACRDLSDVLQTVVDAIDDLKKRNWLTKAITCLRIYTPPFQQRLAGALDIFHVKMSVESQKLSEKLLESMTDQMNELRITRNQLDKIPGAESAIAPVDARIHDLEEKMNEIRSVQARIEESMNSVVPQIVTQLAEHVRSDGDDTR